MSKTHELKTWPAFFRAVLDGRKTFEVRKNDRDFSVGDLLHLHEWEPATPQNSAHYTGRVIARRVTYILPGAFGLEPNYVVMSLGDVTQTVAPD